MLDREKVIKGLTELKKYLPSTMWESINDALSLLKEKEPVEPTINEYGEAFCICGENVGIIPRSKNLPSVRLKYCSECGRRMKWKYD